MSFTESWGDLPRNQLLDFLADHVGTDYSITELAESTSFSRPTIYRALADLEQLSYVKETRTLGQSRLFMINTKHPLIVAVLRGDFEEARETAEREAHSRPKAVSRK